MERIKQKSALVVMAAIMGIMSCPLMAFAADGDKPALYGTIWGLLPPVVAIALALITKEVYSSLFVGIVAGGILFAGANFMGVVNHVVIDGFIGQVSDAYNVGILIFLIVLGILVAMMNKTGGSAAFGEWARKKIKHRTGAQLATVLLGVLIFIDDYFNCLTVGSIMRPITDSHNISRAKLAYLIDATAAPVCIIAPISSWAAAVAGFVPGTNGFTMFLRTIPYNYYALLTITFMIAITVMRVDFGPMRVHENNAIERNDLYTTPDRPYEDAGSDAIKGKGTLVDLVLPVVVLIIGCALGMMYSGGFFASGKDHNGFIDAFSNSDASVGLSTASIVVIVLASIFYIARRVMNFQETMDCIPEGFKAMIAPCLILTCAWTLKSMTDSLGAAEFVADIIKGSAGSLMNMLPAIIFLIACGLGFATGTSWGTFGILIPIVVAAFNGIDEQLMIISMSACMAGAVFGDHCSPISDTTIMASAGAQCQHINHVSTQIPYTVTVGLTSCVAFLFAGFVRNVLISLVFGFALMVVVLVVIMKMYGREEDV